ncbi:Ditrans,polycis-undecaprenyl-diphosphate synthase ((2E,6E)-farnesyl-diphosphate specific) [Hydrogenovibrio crunogenus]|uniref:Ditrans,polycis-undecaprenyl-diphosphate synthase ((2E,6E)-farnesyl-diphosphate specific) n=1 Tax=Hydrogenovibrio crunogenus TaxID=39765 RepID=A0A4P7P0A0_9GAMM|nr:isoprenyl transferase [Hydrogenovibrio crunogenus]QBZ83309.1 Ditrans,polycis-undecaprenyl-diphosphate synthase ((2E,6E)-farnesyl-diphosphate specific) [Hydrogenovibrio crunogenus]RUM91794.1 MAG: di-trans,poly-cis-decaprenylcistransferase [Thiomicrospira sp.]
MSSKSTSPTIPKHIAIIMDGNGRWAKKRMLPRFVGHQKGLNAVKRVVSRCAELGVDSLTLFAFSTENWKRPEEEVNKLMGLFLKALQKEVSKLHENQVRLRIIGDRDAFNEEIQAHIVQAEQLTENNTGLTLNIAANYGGRWDVVDAVKRWHQANPTKEVSDLSESDICHYISLADQPVPDLLIRTGGEQRISNFLIWQMAYAEFYFCDELWPDFNEESIDRAIASFQQRERRFGKTSEQVAQC